MDKQNAVIVADVEFDRDSRLPIIRGEDSNFYRLIPKWSKVAAAMTVRELTAFVGQIANVNADGLVVSFTRNPMATTEDGDSIGGADSFACAAPDRVAADDRVRLERYGVAVSLDVDGLLFCYHVTRSGAINPEAIRVDRPSPEFLADVNTALGTSFTLDHFPGAMVAGA